MTNHESRFYTTLQYQEYIDDDENYRTNTENNTVFAKAIKKGLSRDMSKSGAQYYKYYIRCSCNKNLFDPFPKYSISGNRESFVDRVCKNQSCFKEVTQSIFDKYLNYLKTENSQWLKNAQKEFNNNAR